MASLTGQTIQSTYDALLKISGNDALTSSLQRITDGLGNFSPLYLSTTAVEISSGLNVIGSITGSNLSGTNTGDETNSTIKSKLGAATSSNDGYLTSTDWSTFNNKQNALTNPVTGTGTTNTLPKFTGASTIGNSNITDTGSLITLGSNSYVNGNLGIGSTGLTQYNLRLERSITGNATSFSFYNAGIVQSDVTTTANYNATYTNTDAASFTLAGMNHYNAIQGIFGAGSTVTTQSGFRADSSLIGATNNYGFRGLIPSGTNRWNLYMDGTANNHINGALGMSQTSLTGYNVRISRNISGATNSLGISVDSAIQSDVTSRGSYYHTSASTQNTAFTLGILDHYFASGGSSFGSATVTNQYGFRVDSTLTGATNNYGFFGNIGAGTNRWNLYMAGTANNYLAGALGIGTTTLTGYTVAIGKAITGAGTSIGVYQTGTVQSDVTSSAFGFRNDLNTQAATFTLPVYTHYAANQSTIGAGTTLTTQIGFSAGTFTGGANVFGFRGQVAAASGRWNLYMDGTAQNYLAGNLGIGTTSPASLLNVAGGNVTVSAGFGIAWSGDQTRIMTPEDNVSGALIQTPGIIRFNAGGSEKVRITSGGNVGIGTTTLPSILTVGDNGTGLQFTNAASGAFNIGLLAGTGSPDAYIYNRANSPLIIGTNNAERMRITSAGNVGIGTTSPSTQLHLNGSADIRMSNSANTSGFDIGMLGGNADANAYIYQRANSNMILATNNTERMRIASDGAIQMRNVYNRQTTSYTLVLGDAGKIVEMNVAGTNNNLTVPPNSSVAFPIGTEIFVTQYGSGQTSFVAGSGVTIRSDAGKLTIANQYKGACLVKVGTDEWYLIGSLK